MGDAHYDPTNFVVENIPLDFDSPGSTAVPPTTPAWNIDADDFVRVAHPQTQCSFLTRLPVELRRRIYVEVWRSIGLSRHVYLRGEQFAYMPCATSHSGPDERQVELDRQSGEPVWYGMWSQRLRSYWGNHWRCEEALIAKYWGVPDGPKEAGLAAVLRCCKKMYLESHPLLFQNLTLSFHRLDTALHFLVTQKQPISDHLTHINLSVSPTFSATWESHFTTLKELLGHLATRQPPLQKLHIWMDGMSPFGRFRLLGQEEHFQFDPRLLPALTLSLPVYTEQQVAGFQEGKPRPWIEARGYSHWWQPPRRAQWGRPQWTSECADPLDELIHGARQGATWGNYKARLSSLTEKLFEMMLPAD